MWGNNEKPTDDKKTGRIGGEMPPDRLQELAEASVGVFGIGMEHAFQQKGHAVILNEYHKRLSNDETDVQT